MTGMMQDLRSAARALTRRPGLAAATVLTLGVGIGANVSMFTLVNAVLFRTAPVEEPGRLAFVFTGREGQPHGNSSHPDYVDLRDHARAFEGLAAFGRTSVSLSDDTGAEEVAAGIVSGNFFDVLGVPAALGRTLSPADDKSPGGHPVVVIGHGLWQRRFGGDADVLHRPIRINGHAFAVVGVAPPGFRGAEVLENDELWAPMAMQAVVRPPRAGFAAEMNADLLSRRDARWLQMVGRLRPGVDVSEAGAEIAGLFRALAARHPETNAGRTASMFPLDRVHPFAYPILVRIAGLLLGGAALLLAVACANVANLLLARALGRRREIAVRLALGASRSRLVRQFLAEGLLLAAAGGALGLVVAHGVVDLLRRTPPQVGIFSFTLDTPLDGRVLAFTIAVSLATVLAFALVPALQASRPDVVPALKDGAHAGQPRGPRRGWREALVVAQVAASVVVLGGAGLLVRSASGAAGLDPGFDAERVLVGRLDVDLLRLTTQEARTSYETVVERVSAVPGVEAVSLARTVPLEGGGRRVSLDVDGRPWPPARDGSPHVETVGANVVGRNYFDTLGIALLRGRDFGRGDTDAAPRVAVVNETFARRYLDAPALGRRISVDGPQGPWWEVVGVVADSRYRRLTEDATAFVYLPLGQRHETGVSLHVRTGAAPEIQARVTAAVSGIVRSLEPDLPPPDVRPLADVLRSSLFPARMGATIFATLGATALALAGLGLYGVVAWVVARRTREIGIRLALGACRGDIAKLVLGQGMTLVATGLAVGLVAALAIGRLIEGLLFGIRAADAPTWAGIVAGMVVAGLLACALPLRRVLHLDPVVALRHD